MSDLDFMYDSIEEHFVLYDLEEEQRHTTVNLLLKIFFDSKDRDFMFYTLVEKIMKYKSEQQRALTLDEIQELVFKNLLGDTLSFETLYKIKANNPNVEEGHYYGELKSFSYENYMIISKDIKEKFNDNKNLLYELKNRRPNLDIEWETIKLIMQVSDYIVTNQEFLAKMRLAINIKQKNQFGYTWEEELEEQLNADTSKSEV